MATTAWKFVYGTNFTGSGGADFTSKVLSAVYTVGRQKYLDNYPGGVLRVTIDNTSDYASNISFNTRIFVYKSGAGNGEAFWVQEVNYDDYPGNTGLPTATITAIDALGRAGRVQADAYSLTQVATGTQAYQLSSAAGGPLISTILVQGNLVGQSTASAQTYTGTVLNQWNLLNTTERGTYQAVADSSGVVNVYPFARNTYQNRINSTFTFGRTASASVIAYDQFDRIQNGVEFINTATVSPSGLSSQTATNSASITAYGQAFYSSSTVDYNTTQAANNAQWVVNTFSDPASLRFTISFTDLMQNTSAYGNFMSSLTAGNLASTLTYRIPGAVADTTVDVLLEGWTVNITPASTRWTLNFSPLTYYQFFTLNSATLGILNTSRLGW